MFSSHLSPLITTLITSRNLGSGQGESNPPLNPECPLASLVSLPSIGKSSADVFITTLDI